MTKTSYWQVFRFIFVVFFLYLMGDAFHRWDGFKLYASLSEFLLSIALASVLLSLLTAAFAFLIWIPFICVELISEWKGLKRQKDLCYLFILVFLLVSAVIWSAKRSFFPLFDTTVWIKYITLFFAAGISILFTYMLRNIYGRWTGQVKHWFQVIQSRITPLVWVFGIIVLVSAPIVGYQTWVSDIDRDKKTNLHKVAQKSRPNIIFVTFDAMSARNMSLYGYEIPTTPFIDEMAESATVFARAEAESNFTAPTTSSLITGKRVWSHLRFSRMRGSPPVKTDIESLPVVLKDNGYYNMAFMVNMIAEVGNLGVASSFDIYPFPTEFMVARNIVRFIHKFMTPVFYGKFKIHNWFFQEGFITEAIFQRLEKDFTETSYPPEIAFNDLITATDRTEKPFFAWIHLNPPHSPYLPPEPYKGMFDNSGDMLTFKTQLKQRNDLLEYRSVHGSFPAGLATLRARYDEFIRYCDSQFKEFIEQMEEEGKLENTIIILSTDHGEIFDHNNILHGDTLYEPETHIPLVIKEPGQTKGRIVDNIVEQIDIPATILDLAGISVPAWMEGRSIVPLMRGEDMPERPAFAMNLEKNHRDQFIDKGDIAVWEGDYKMIHNLEKRESMLFNLRNDPGELDNLIDREPEVGRRLLDLIHENLKKANDKIAKGN